MSARKAVAQHVNERVGERRTIAPEDRLERPIQRATADERNEPAVEQQFLTTDQQVYRSRHHQYRHRDGTTDGAYCPGYRNAQSGSLRVDPVVEAQIQTRYRGLIGHCVGEQSE